ncbi:MAG TPA: YhdP family protein [Methylophaga sp.]|nr:YhdP family protein [Methylophaga sp.]
MALFRKGLHIAGKQLVIIAGVVAALLLLLIGSAAWLSQAVAERKDEIAQWASERTDYQIEIGEANLYWLDFLPKLMLADVSVLTPSSQKPILTFDSLYIGVDVLKSLQQQQAVIGSASINGLRLGVMRNASGQFSIRDLDWQPDDIPSGDTLWQSMLFNLQRLQLQDIVLNYQDAYQPSLSGHYQLNQAILTRSGKKVTADINLTLPQHLGQQLLVSGELLRDGQDISEWEMTLDGSQLQFAALLEGHQIKGVAINQGRGNLQVTARKQANKIIANGLLSIQNSRFYQPAKAEEENTPAPLVVNNLNTKFTWMQQGQSWQLNLPSLSLAVNGEVWPQSQLQASFDPDTGTRLTADYLRLSDLSAAAALIDDAPDWLKTYAPAGDVKNIKLSVNKDQQIQQLQATVDELGFEESADIPGMTGLSFTVDWNDQQIALLIDSQDVALYAKNWLPDTVYLDAFNGRLIWQQAAQGGKLNVERLQLVNDDFNARITGSFTHAQTQHADLTLTLADFDIASWLDYVPEKVLEPDFLKWAQKAFVAGQISKGEIKLQGDPSAFPFEKQPDAGKFSLQLAVNDVELNYGKGWPHLKSVNGQISGSGNDLQITTDNGTIAGFNFVGVKASISNLINGLPELTLNGAVQGEAQQGLSFLKNSPLASRFGPIADWLTISGNTLIKLDLDVPLLNTDATQVIGEITLQDNQLVLTGLSSLPIEQLSGQINFDNDGLSAEQLNAQILGEAAVIDIVPQDNRTRIQISSAFEVDRLASNWQLNLPAAISGGSELLANIDIAEAQPGDFAVEISLNSDLQGVAIDLPAPFKKSAESLLPLQVKLLPEEALHIELQLANWLNTVAVIADEDLRAAISLGDETARLPASGISISGELETLSVSDWLQWWQQYSTKDTESKLQVESVDLRFERLQWHALKLTDVAINVQRQSAVWQIKLAAKQLKGDINWPVNDDSLPTLHFDFVDLPLPGDVIQKRDQADLPTLWPGFKLNIDNLVLDDMKLGRLQAHAERDALRWQLVSASLQSPTLQATATGNWRRNDDGDNSQLSLQLSSDDLANLLVDLGYQPTITAKRVNVEGDFTWPGAPLNFSRRDLLGHMQLDVGRGELKEVEPGAAGRIFGLLSFTAIPRRLSLDFSDLFGSGFSFSSINGRFDFANGLATTHNLEMRGDSASVSVTGPINLIERTYNQTVEITPKVASTLPIAGAVAGGPVGLGVGTAIFLVDKLASNLFGKELVDFITYRYKLTGPWHSPEMTLITTEQP